MNLAAGFEEIAHTADWALRVWAPDLEGLLEQAARGMYTLSGIEIGARPELRRVLEIEAADAEMLLVEFLEELLYWAESERAAFHAFATEIAGLKLKAGLIGGPIQAWKKEIKAVTCHNLQIQQTSRGLEVEIVFDV